MHRHALTIAASWLLASSAVASPPPPEEVPPEPVARFERGAAWTVSVVSPIVLTDVRREGVRAPVFALAGGGELMGGWESPFQTTEGITWALLAGSSAHPVEGGAWSTSRFGAGAYWTFGDPAEGVAPHFGLVAGALFSSLAGPTEVTAFARLDLGAQILVWKWMAVDLSLGVEGALPGGALDDAVAFLVPRLGISFYGSGTGWDW